jgi:hypothetical protein
MQLGYSITQCQAKAYSNHLLIPSSVLAVEYLSIVRPSANGMTGKVVTGTNAL